MKEESEVFREWYELNFEEPPDPLEYVYLRDSLDFQRYLLWCRYKELVELIRRELWDVFRKLVSKVSIKSQKVREQWKNYTLRPH